MSEEITGADIAKKLGKPINHLGMVTKDGDKVNNWLGKIDSITGNVRDIFNMVNARKAGAQQIATQEGQQIKQPLPSTAPKTQGVPTLIINDKLIREHIQKKHLIKFLPEDIRKSNIEDLTKKLDDKEQLDKIVQFVVGYISTVVKIEMR